ncbi:MAG TPA: squalene synthase HpnC [Acidobacteriaceae bacterium]|nr:squalene synthase HpnC [Acidobacteriaceae bacterium]
MSEISERIDDTLTGAPAEYRTPAVRPALGEAKAWCESLAETHYENFHVATWFLPKRLRPHFKTIYAYCRVADDLGDEVGDPALSTALLASWRAMLDECYDAPERSRHPVFVALAETVRECAIPREPFADLLVAFTRDQTKTRYETIAELEDYARYSANPVGRLVLYTAGIDEPRLHALSDKVCTGLQFANLWQDVSEDYAAGRVYIPVEEMRRFGVGDPGVLSQWYTPQYRAMMKSLVDHTYGLFTDGRAICGMVDPELAVTLGLFIDGGEAILDEIVKMDYNTLEWRPSLSKLTKARLLVKALWRKVRA